MQSVNMMFLKHLKFRFYNKFYITVQFQKSQFGSGGGKEDFFSVLLFVTS